MTVGEGVGLCALLLTGGGMLVGLGRVLEEIKQVREDNAETKAEVKELTKDVRAVMLAQAEARGAATSHVTLLPPVPTPALRKTQGK